MEIKCSYKHICYCLNGKKETHKGFRWEYAINEHPQERKVNQINPDTSEIIKTHSSIREASREVKGSSSHISACLNGKSKTHKGFRWAYA